MIPNQPLRVMHVDDDPADIELFQLLARKIGINATFQVARDGVDALNKLLTAETSGVALPHFIILDLNMPKKDGRQLLSELKSDPRLMIIPIIICTTSMDKEDIRYCYERGASCYAVKPIDLQEFQALVGSLFAFWESVEFLYINGNSDMRSGTK